MDITSAFQGISTPVPVLLEKIASYGWEAQKVNWDKQKGAFVASARNAHGEVLARTGPDDKTALGNLIVAIARHTHIRTTAQYKVGMWKTMFTDQLQPIAEAYAKAPVYDAKAAGYFKELADDSVRRAATIGKQIHVEVVDDPEPYANAREMSDDIHKNKHFFVSRANSEHPIWTVDQNVAFRTVHDVLGHAVSGGDFGWQGENLACAAHFPLLTPTAQLALFTECIAQTAYAAYYRSFGPQKVALFPQFVEGPQGGENAPGHAGVHPSQVAVPTTMPNLAESPPANTPHDEGAIAPHQEALGLTPVMSPMTFSKVASLFADPNAGWESGMQPMQPETHGVGNAYLHHGDPLESNAVMDNARLIDTGWSQFQKGDGTPDVDRMKQAIVNAFRVVLLSPRKDLRWNAIHYQDIAHIPASTDHPKVYWDALEGKRRAWNTAQGIHPDAHMPYFKFLKPFESVIYQMHPDLGPEGAKRKADETLFSWWTEEQQRVESEDAEKPSDKQRSSDEIERRANEALARRIAIFLKDKTNVKTDVADAQPMSLFGAYGYPEGWVPDHIPLQPSQELVNHDDHLVDDQICPQCGSDISWQQNFQTGTRWRHCDTCGYDDMHAMPGGKGDPLEQAYKAAGLNKNYVDLKAKQIKNALKPDEVPDDHADELMRLYALLALTKGKSTSLEDIHDAWSTWTAEIKPRHKSLKPFEDLEKEIQDYDKPYRDAVRKCAAGGQYNLLTGEESLKYGAFMGTHLKAISKVSQHADELLDAALKDVQEHDGSGHHFRAQTLALNISGVGPKVCSFAWLLLQPMTSQLATIDTHMMDVLGHHYEKEMNNRDYFKFERELAAGRDASGYGHVPLGTFQWGMWDHKRTGPGSHQDHSAMRVLDPKPHQDIDWVNKAQNLKGESWLEQAPDWWRNTQAARDAVAQQWDTQVAPGTAQNQIPYQVMNDQKTASLFKEAGESEDEFHVGIALPEEVIQKCSEFAATIDGFEPDDPQDYHITMFWSEVGYSDQDLHDWIRTSSVSGLRFYNARIDNFPGHNGKNAVVLRLDSPEAKKLANKLMDEAEDRGLEIKRFDGGWKAHITLGWSKEPVDGEKFPELDFRAGPLYVSIPRPLRKTADSEFSKGFAYWWNKEKPHYEWDAGKMAEYARGTKTKRKDAEEFVDKHKDDVRGDFKDFKRKFLKKFDALKTSALGDDAPSVDFHRDGEHDTGAPGESIMGYLTSQTNLSTPEVWKLYGDEHVDKVGPDGRGYREGDHESRVLAAQT